MYAYVEYPKYVKSKDGSDVVVNNAAEEFRVTGVKPRDPNEPIPEYPKTIKLAGTDIVIESLDEEKAIVLVIEEARKPKDVKPEAAKPEAAKSAGK